MTFRSYGTVEERARVRRALPSPPSRPRPHCLGPSRALYRRKMTDSTSIYVPRSVGELVEDVHQEEARPGEPKWRTVERSIRALADAGGTDE